MGLALIVTSTQKENRNQRLDGRVKATLERVNTDLAGPVEPVAKYGVGYTFTFTWDYSLAVFVCFLKAKSNAVKVTEKLIAHCLAAHSKNQVF